MRRAFFILALAAPSAFADDSDSCYTNRDCHERSPWAHCVNDDGSTPKRDDGEMGYCQHSGRCYFSSNCPGSQYVCIFVDDSITFEDNIKQGHCVLIDTQPPKRILLNGSFY